MCSSAGNGQLSTHGPPSLADSAAPGNLVEGHYRYMQDLLALEATATGLGPSCFAPATPLVLPAWTQALADHPDKQFTDYILKGMSCGFHIGVDRTKSVRRSRQGNLPSVKTHPALVADHLTAESEAGRLLGPVPEPLAKLCQISPLGLIPKPHQPGKWRLIVDLSSPQGRSVNDAISPELCHLRYASVLDAAALVRHLGKGTTLAKIDLHQAYRSSQCTQMTTPFWEWVGKIRPSSTRRCRLGFGLPPRFSRRSPMP